MKRFVFLALSAALLITGVSAFAAPQAPGPNIMTTIGKSVFTYSLPQTMPNAKLLSSVIGRSPNEQNPMTVIKNVPQANLPTSMADNSGTTGGVTDHRS